jgi:integrase/recombinase XerD
MIFDPWKITRRMFLSEEEVERLLGRLSRRVRQAAPAELLSRSVDEVIIHTLLYSGLKNSEFCGLNLADVDLVRGLVHVRDSPREGRSIYIPKALCELLKQYCSEVRPGCLRPGTAARDPAQPLVVGERGRRYDRTGLYRRVARILGEAGFAARSSVKLLRHTYGYLAYLRTGGNLLFVQRQLGHAHPLVTAVYAPFADPPYESMADTVASLRKPAQRKRAVKKTVSSHATIKEKQ